MQKRQGWEKGTGKVIVITQDQFNAVCDLMEESTLGLPHLCKQVGISTRSFYEFKKENDKAEKRYAQSKNMQCELIAYDILDIADDGSNDLMSVVKGDVEYETERKEVVNRSRLRVDSRKWLLSKLNPKKFGDKLDLTSDGEKIQPPGELRIIIDNPVKQNATD